MTTCKLRRTTLINLLAIMFELTPVPLKANTGINIDRDLEQACAGFREFRENVEHRKNSILTASNSRYTDARLRQDLLDMQETDQALRFRATRDMANQALERAVRLYDFYSTARLRRMSSGVFPSKSEVGEDGIHAAWLIIQHSPDLDLQKLALREFKRRPSILSPADLAMLEDRIDVKEGRPQKYGSQFEFRDGKLVPSTVADTMLLPALRQAAELMPFSIYECVVNRIYKIAPP